jgi:glucose-6-phosphate 1-dehydrogenase
VDDVEGPEIFTILAQTAERFEAAAGLPNAFRVYYLALPPVVYPAVCSFIKAHGEARGRVCCCHSPPCCAASLGGA